MLRASLEANGSLQVLVFWLASGDLSMYEVIINGRDDGDFDQIARDIDYSLEDERWWQDIKRLRQPDGLSASQELAQTVDLLEAVTSWPIGPFQHGRRDSKPKRFAALQKLLRKTKNRTPLRDLRGTSDTVDMRSQRLPADLLADSDSDTHQSSDKDDDADDEAVGSESEPGISGSNFDQYDLDASTDESDDDHPRMSSRRRGKTTLSAASFSKKLDLRRAIWKGSSRDNSLKDDKPTAKSVSPLKPHLGTTASDTVVPRTRKTNKSHSIASSTSQLSSASHARSVKPPSTKEGSLPKFTSNPVPRSAVASEEGAGPSIMFVDTPSPTFKSKDHIATAPSPSHAATSSGANSAFSSTQPTASPASGYPAQQAIPLSFNDLPCRAQHLILNELLRRHSDDTAVVFTTLPSPMEGTCESERESVRYISDLEVLCQGLPPVLLVHSNSMTVTMNL
jgi:potassium/chloride transporter 9